MMSSGSQDNQDESRKPEAPGPRNGGQEGSGSAGAETNEGRTGDGETSDTEPGRKEPGRKEGGGGDTGGEDLDADRLEGANAETDSSEVGGPDPGSESGNQSEGPEAPESLQTSGAPEASGRETTECPNCGRLFESSHCPSCGLAAGHPQSALGVVSTFLQELIDVQRGLWPTLKALAIRPGEALRQHLGAGPRPLMNPGRYLLTAIVVNFGTVRALTWLGMREGAAQRLSDEMTEAEAKAAQAGAAEEQVLSILSKLTGDLQVAFTSQTYYVASSLLLAAILALAVWRLFGEQIDRGAQALAFSFFTVGQAVFLETVLWATYVPVARLATGAPARLDSSVGGVVPILYVTAATWRTFGPGWRAAGKGAVASVWATVEQLLIIGSAVGTYSLWVVYSRTAGEGDRPTLNLTFQTGDTETALLSVGMSFAAVFVVPVLLHACIEAYCRLR